MSSSLKFLTNVGGGRHVDEYLCEQGSVPNIF